MEKRRDIEREAPNEREIERERSRDEFIERERVWLLIPAKYT